MRNQYGVMRYRDNDTGRQRWAVLHFDSCAWYFPRCYGLAAARRLQKQLATQTGGA